MLVIASKTGWSEEHIGWELPYARGFAYYHAARVLEGERCQWPGGNAVVKGWVENVRDWATGWRGKGKSTHGGR